MEAKWFLGWTLHRKFRISPRFFLGEGGGTPRKSIGVRSASRNLTPFMTKTRDFPYLIYDLIQPVNYFVSTDRALFTHICHYS